MRKIAILFILLIACFQPLQGLCRNFAIIAGGTHEPLPDSPYSHNIFSHSMGEWSRTLKERNWDVSVLFDGVQYLEDWNEFHRDVRPLDQNTMAQASFTKDNLTSKINKLLEQHLTSEDQVELSISAHGSVRHDQFGIKTENGNMEADNLKAILEKLLETGARVHINLDSCYSGQFIKNATDLLRHPSYADKLCITTQASQDAEGQVEDSILAGMSNFINLGHTQNTSAEELFLKARRHRPSLTEDFLRAIYEKKFYQISSFPEWMDGPLHHTEAILSLPDVEQPREVTQTVCSLEPDLFEDIQNRIRPVADIFSQLTKKSLNDLTAQERLQIICSKDYQDRLSNRYFDQKDAFEHRYDLPHSAILSSEASQAFLTRRKDKCTLDGSSFAYPIKDKEGNVLCQFDTEELLAFIIDNETQDSKKTTLVTKNLSQGLGEKKLNQLLADYRPFYTEWMEGQCDAIRLYALEHELFEESYRRLPQTSNKRACQEFHF